MKKVKIYQYITQLNSDFSDFLTSSETKPKKKIKTILKARLTRVCEKCVKK